MVLFSFDAERGPPPFDSIQFDSIRFNSVFLFHFRTPRHTQHSRTFHINTGEGITHTTNIGMYYCSMVCCLFCSISHWCLLYFASLLLYSVPSSAPRCDAMRCATLRSTSHFNQRSTNWKKKIDVRPYVYVDIDSILCSSSSRLLSVGVWVDRAL